MGLKKANRNNKKAGINSVLKMLFLTFVGKKLTQKPQVSIPKSIKTNQNTVKLFFSLFVFLSLFLCTSSVRTEIFLRNVEKRNIYGRYNHSSKILPFSP